MNKIEIEQESLERAQSGNSAANYTAIFLGFQEKGIPFSEIKPRENIFTFNAWKALNRVVKRGEKGVQIVAWIPFKNKNGEQTVRPKTTTVFHISQTEDFMK